MKRIRKGNDIQFTWTIQDLSGVSGDKVVLLVDQLDNAVDIEYTINGDVVTGTFYGKDQENIGVYRLLLLVNDGRKHMVTLDHIRVFSLVDISDFGIMDGQDDDGVIVAVIDTHGSMTISTGGIRSIIYTGKDSEGGNIYTVTLLDGATYEMVMPKGDKGDQGTTDYNDLINKPTIPPALILSDWLLSNNGFKDYIKNKPNLATVATSGSYNDLLDKPTIPVDTNTYRAIELNGDQVLGSDDALPLNFVAGSCVSIASTTGNDNKTLTISATALVNSDWNASSGVAEILNKPTIPQITFRQWSTT